MGAPRHWIKLESEWKAVLDRYGVPSFHAKDFFGRRNKGESASSPYREWSDGHAVRFLRELTEIIAAHRVFPVVTSVETAAFEARTEDERRFLTGGGMDELNRPGFDGGSDY